jgi:hypothetical protein
MAVLKLFCLNVRAFEGGGEYVSVGSVGKVNIPKSRYSSIKTSKYQNRSPLLPANTILMIILVFLQRWSTEQKS